ncbi:hypothetical protein BJV82DRAFT_630967 [Fennellomyces sp. T-0311]|nr:hypothetical protein BJV82DRAFT_630967 [Fennellomyces sp. T-0311]
MSGFPDCLPSDIVLSIFFYLDRKDTIECMRVCHHWYIQIPLCATDLWKSISISSTSLNKPNDCELRCLGPHVNHVIISKQDISTILKALKHMNCGLVAIEIANVEYIEMQKMCTEAKLLSSIGLFHDTLKILVITNYYSDISPLQLLSCSPNLTHLSLTFHDQAGLLPSPVRTSRNTCNLVYLNLGYTVDFDHRVMPVMRHCPQLKVLILTNNMTEAPPLSDSWNQIIQLCPQLHHFGLNELDAPYNAKDIAILTEKYNDDKGIRELVLRSSIDEINSISSLLTRLNDLEDLKLSNRKIASSGWDSLAHVHFPRLKTMAIHNLLVRNDAWDSFCACRPNLVSFSYKQMLVNGLDMDRMIAAISSLNHLEHLNIFFFLSRMMGQIPNIWSNVSMLSSNTQLRTLELTGIRFAGSALLDLCRLSSLKDLRIFLWPFYDDILSGELLEFADRIRHTGIEKLALSHFNFLNDEALEPLGQATHLSMLRLLGNLITDAGVIAVINGHKTVEVDDCKLVSRNGIWTYDQI